MKSYSLSWMPKIPRILLPLWWIFMVFYTIGYGIYFIFYWIYRGLKWLFTPPSKRTSYKPIKKQVQVRK